MTAPAKLSCEELIDALVDWVHVEGCDPAAHPGAVAVEFGLRRGLIVPAGETFTLTQDGEFEAWARS